MTLIKKLEKLPPKREDIETLDILRQLSKSSTALGELKGIDIEDTTFSVESFNEYNSIISEKKDKYKN